VEIRPNSVLYSTTEGSEPFIEILKSQLLLIQYSNGDHEIYTDNPQVEFERGGIYKPVEHVRNIISFSPLDIVFMRFQMSYEHINKDGTVGFRVPMVIGFYNEEPSYFTGFDINMYPAGQNRISYFLGPKIRAGYVNDYIFNEELFTAFLFNNGMVVHTGSDLTLSFAAGIGVAHSFDSSSTIPMATLSFLLGFRF